MAEVMPSAPKTRRGIEYVIARHIDVQTELDKRTFEIATRAEEALKRHRVENIAHIEIEQGDFTDWYVVLEDTQMTPNESAADNSALSIEFGRAGYIDSDGLLWGEMRGLFILTDAAHLPHRNKPIARKKRDRDWQAKARKKKNLRNKRTRKSGGE
jgi:hypothetical protein